MLKLPKVETVAKSVLWTGVGLAILNRVLPYVPKVRNFINGN